MAAMVYKWLFVFLLSGINGGQHPLFISVTEIGYNASEQSLEVSCKLFTDDFEAALSRQYNKSIDLLDAKSHAASGILVREYTNRHLSILLDGKPVRLDFVGFEQQEEGTISYYEARKVAKPTRIEVVNSLLYEDKPQQMGIIHVMVNGERKSSRLNNPEDRASFQF
jgi:hypothetical protein